MAKVKVSGPDDSSNESFRPALTPEARSNQLISLAEDLAEKQLREGTASSQLITHYLKLATARERLEIVKLENETALLLAKKNAIEKSEKSDELYEKAIQAMRRYSGHGDVDEDY